MQRRGTSNERFHPGAEFATAARRLLVPRLPLIIPQPNKLFEVLFRGFRDGFIGREVLHFAYVHVHVIPIAVGVDFHSDKNEEEVDGFDAFVVDDAVVWYIEAFCVQCEVEIK